MTARPDIHSGAQAARGDGRGGPSGRPGDVLTPAEFARKYEDARRTLWFIAAAILGDRTLAHDVVQEAAAIAMTKLADFQTSTNFTAWMGQIVRFVALNEARSRQRRRTTLTIDDLDAPHRPGPRPDHRALDDHVAAGLMSLDEAARTCLVLRIVHGMSYAEISHALNIPEGTAMSHVHRSRIALRERLRGREEELRGTAGAGGAS